MNQIIYEQIASIIDEKLPLVSNLSNVSAVLNQLKDINWVGFYFVDGDTLYLGPFQGEPACARIPKGKGVCGTSFERKESIIVDDVNKFQGHIVCSTKSKSEIVVPIMRNDQVLAVIDIDSPIYSRFNEKDEQFLVEVAKLLMKLFK